MVFTVLIFMSVLVGIHGYLAFKIAFVTAMPAVGKISVGFALAFFFFMMLGRLVFYKRIPKKFNTMHAYFAYCWMGSMFFLLLSFILTDLIFWILPWLVAQESIDLVSTVVNLKTIIALTCAGLVSLFAFFQARRGPKVKPIKIDLEQFPKNLSGFKIVQISDLHIGDIIQESYVKNVVALCNAENPDLIVITGDLIDAPLENIKEHAQPLKKFSAKYGVFFVTGNHEYYAGAQEWINHFKSLNIQTLRNETVSIGKNDDTFNLAGVDDVTGGHFISGHGADVKKAVQHAISNKATILLSHQPKTMGDAKTNGVDLQLSGHTHNGQMWPFNFLVALDQPYLKGLYQDGASQIYVNPGTGFWGPPMRFFGRSEISSIGIFSK